MTVTFGRHRGVRSLHTASLSLKLEGRTGQNLGFLSDTHTHTQMCEGNHKATTLDNVQKQEGLESLTDSVSKSRVPPVMDTE